MARLDFLAEFGCLWGDGEGIGWVRARVGDKEICAGNGWVRVRVGGEEIWAGADCRTSSEWL